MQMSTVLKCPGSGTNLTLNSVTHMIWGQQLSMNFSVYSTFTVAQSALFATQSHTDPHQEMMQEEDMEENILSNKQTTLLSRQASRSTRK